MRPYEMFFGIVAWNLILISQSNANILEIEGARNSGAVPISKSAPSPRIPKNFAFCFTK